MATSTLEEIFHPRSIAVVGASDNPDTRGYHYMRLLVDSGYGGKIYPVNPRYAQILGMKAYQKLSEVPESVDYVISCIPASEVLDLLEACSQKKVKAVQMYTARFSETGRPEAAQLEQEVLKLARRSGIRIIGPNCMGIYYPKVGLAFGYLQPRNPGPVGMIFQTGGGASSFIRMASLRGVRFSKGVSYGNALDLNESDYLDYFLEDPETKVILMYVEGARDGKRFLTTLGKAAPKKPVIILKGGRGKSGARIVASHTASIAGSTDIWKTAVAQMGAVFADNLDEMVDLAVSFSFLPPIKGTRVGVVGGGGGPSVLSADDCEAAGLDVIALPKEMREELKNKGVPVWDWVGNPTDSSILGGSGFTDFDMLRMMANNNNFDLIIVNINELVRLTLTRKEEAGARLRDSVDRYIKAKEGNPKPMLAVIGEGGPDSVDFEHWSWQLLSELRTKLIGASIPIYPNIQRAARAAYKLAKYYQKSG